MNILFEYLDWQIQFNEQVFVKNKEEYSFI